MGDPALQEGFSERLWSWEISEKQLRMVLELPETLWVRIIQPSEIWALVWSSVLPLLWTELTTERLSQSYQRVPTPPYFMKSLPPSTQTANGLLKSIISKTHQLLPMRFMYSGNYQKMTLSLSILVTRRMREKYPWGPQKIIIMFPGYRC